MAFRLRGFEPEVVVGVDLISSAGPLRLDRGTINFLGRSLLDELWAAPSERISAACEADEGSQKPCPASNITERHNATKQQIVWDIFFPQ